MTRPVFHKIYEIPIAFMISPRAHLVQQVTNGMYDFEILFFVIAANIVSFTDFSFFKYRD
jgi:hypothetical protein